MQPRVPSLLFREVYKLHCRLHRRNSTSFFSQEGRPFSNKLADPRVLHRLDPWLWSFVTREETWLCLMMIRGEEEARGADSGRLACLSFVSGLFTPKWATILRTENGLSSFSCTIKSRSDICVVLYYVYRIERRAIKRTVLVREQLTRLSRKLNVIFIKFLRENRTIVRASLCYKYNRAPQTLVFRIIIEET